MFSWSRDALVIKNRNYIIPYALIRDFLHVLMESFHHPHLIRKEIVCNPLETKQHPEVLKNSFSDSISKMFSTFLSFFFSLLFSFTILVLGLLSGRQI